MEPAEPEGLLRIAMADLEPLAHLTVQAVPCRSDADPTPHGLDREAFNREVKELIARVHALVMQGSEAEA